MTVSIADFFFAVVYEFRLDLTLLEFQAEFEVWDKLNSLSQIDTIFIGSMTVSIADSFCCCCVFRLDLTICVVDKIVCWFQG